MTKEHAPEPKGWLLTRRYPDEPSALRTYESARDLLFSQDLDASVYRFTVSGVSHVAVVGDIAIDSNRRATIEAVLDKCGERTDLPDEAFEQLRERRQAFQSTGADYFERRTSRSPGWRTPDT